MPLFERGYKAAATAETEKCYSHFMFHAAITKTRFAFRKFVVVIV